MAASFDKKWTVVMNQPLLHVKSAVFIAIHTTITMLHLVKNILLFFRSLRKRLPVLFKSAEGMAIDGRQLQKTPLHLLLVIGENELNCDSVVDMLVWSFFIGIRCVTVSSRNRTNKKQLQQKFEQRCTKLSSSFLASNLFFNSNQPASHKIHDFNVILTTLKGGKRQFINSCKEICLKSSSKAISLDLINNYVKESSASAMEPDLGICFGPYYSYYGFEPWNVRLTEFLHISTHHRVTYSTFLENLQRFAECKQRQGV